MGTKMMQQMVQYKIWKISHVSKRFRMHVWKNSNIREPEKEINEQ